MDLGLFFRVLWRQKLMLLGGLVVAVAVGTLVAYTPTSAGLTPRATQQYKSSIRLLVSNGNSQVFSSATPQSIPKDASLTQNFSTGDLADIYSQLIMSDTITTRIEKVYGRLSAHGASLAAFRVLAQSPNGFGVSHPRPLPLIEVDATANSPRGARNLAQLTGDEFIRYLNEQENATQIPVAQRITVTETNQAQPGTLSSSNPLILVALIVGGLLVLLIAVAGIRYNLQERKLRRVPIVAAAPAGAAPVEGTVGTTRDSGGEVTTRPDPSLTAPAPAAAQAGQSARTD